MCSVLKDSKINWLIECDIQAKGMETTFLINWDNH